MQSGTTKITLKIKRDQNGTGEENQLSGNGHKQLVLCDLSASDRGLTESVTDLDDLQLVPLPKKKVSFRSSKPMPPVTAFTVQCAKCFKWRLIPTKEKYEEIREQMLEKPFICDTALTWRPDISCEDPPDISQDGSRLWAIDKPNIAQPPSGWRRLLKIRGEGSSKFADVYYVSPKGKKLRSTVEVQKYLDEHPEYVEAGVHLSQFSFQIPRPSNENHMIKRPAKLTTFEPNNGTTRLLEPSLVNPIAWACPDENTDIRLRGPWISSPFPESPSIRPNKRPKNPANVFTTNNVAYDDQQTIQEVEPSQLVMVDEPSQRVLVEELSQPIDGGIVEELSQPSL